MKKKYVKVIGLKIDDNGKFHIVNNSYQNDHTAAGKSAQDHYQDDIIYVGIPFTSEIWFSTLLPLELWGRKFSKNVVHHGNDVLIIDRCFHKLRWGICANQLSTLL